MPCMPDQAIASNYGRLDTSHVVLDKTCGNVRNKRPNIHYLTSTPQNEGH